MENLYFNLSEEEFSKGRKILLWSFAALFLSGGAYILVVNLVLGHKNIPLFIALITFGISLFVSVIATLASIKRKDLFFLVDNEKIEFRFGLLNPKKHSFNWVDIKEVIIPQKQKKTLLRLNDGSSFLINLNWLHRKKSSLIRKHIYQKAKDKNLTLTRVVTLKKNS
jgi:hypothetical protein